MRSTRPPTTAPSHRGRRAIAVGNVLVLVGALVAATPATAQAIAAGPLAGMVQSVTGLGSVIENPLVQVRDAGMSARWGTTSRWVFGDTLSLSQRERFLNHAVLGAIDGYWATDAAGHRYGDQEPLGRRGRDPPSTTSASCSTSPLSPVQARPR